MTIFFDYRGIVHHEYAPKGQNITKEYYLEVLHRLRDAVQPKRPDLRVSGNWQLHQHNALGPFFIADPTFLDETWHFSGSPGSLRPSP